MASERPIFTRRLLEPNAEANCSNQTMLVPRAVGEQSHTEEDRQGDNKVADPETNPCLCVTLPHIEESLHGIEWEQWELARFGGPGSATVKIQFRELCAFVCSCLTEWLSQTKLCRLGVPKQKVSCVHGVNIYTSSTPLL